MHKPVSLKLACLLVALLALSVWLPGALAASGAARQKGDPGPDTRTFRGAWFDVSYPAPFLVKPSLKSTSADGYDSAEFQAPDGAVSFYVFAPQWSGDPADISLVPERELLVEEKRARRGDSEVRWFTVAAKDGSYRRSYRETLSRQGSVKTIVGCKYRSEAARLRYRKAYEQFRGSLRLYAD
jgi:hypothetical protein